MIVGGNGAVDEASARVRIYTPVAAKAADWLLSQGSRCGQPVEVTNGGPPMGLPVRVTSGGLPMGLPMGVTNVGHQWGSTSGDHQWGSPVDVTKRGSTNGPTSEGHQWGGPVGLYTFSLLVCAAGCSLPIATRGCGKVQ